MQILVAILGPMLAALAKAIVDAVFAQINLAASRPAVAVDATVDPAFDAAWRASIAARLLSVQPVENGIRPSGGSGPA